MKKISEKLTRDRPWLRKLLKDRLAIIGFTGVLILFFVAAFAPYLAPYPDAVTSFHPSIRLKPPTLQHLFGTDHLGRDILSRMIWGARLTAVIGIIAVGAALAVGVPIGLLTGYFYEHWYANLLMRGADVVLSIPRLVLALVIASVLGPRIENVILALSVSYWPYFARLVYAQAMSIRRSEFIEAAEALGVPPLQIIVTHLFPNVLSPIIIRATLSLGFTVLAAAMLGFVGAGAQPPSPEWGLMISQAREYLPKVWWYSFFPGLAIFTVVISFNMVGDALRDALDPRLRTGK